MSFKIVKNCRCCGSNNLKKVLDLNEQPLANFYHSGEDQEKYPLVLNVCRKCFHGQLSVVVDPTIIYENYLYTSSTSKTLDSYFKWFSEMVEEDLKIKGTVLEIACNDGSQLKYFKNNGWTTHGIDPAKNLYNLSKNNCDLVVSDYFCKSSLEKLGNVKYNAIVAQNVFGHVDDVLEFLLLCKQNLSDTGNIYIQTSQANMIIKNQFDTIYHEHLSFFSLKSMSALCERAGLYLNSVKITPIHGDSYLFIISKNKKIDSSVKERFCYENKNELYNIKRYNLYKKNINYLISNFRKTILKFKKNGYLIVGYGAAAKGNTFLNHAKVRFNYIIDDNKNKQNLLTPGSNTLILDKDFINNLANNILFVPLAWNFYDEIKFKITKEINNLKFKNKFDYKIYSYYPSSLIESIG